MKSYGFTTHLDKIVDWMGLDSYTNGVQMSKVDAYLIFLLCNKLYLCAPCSDIDLRICDFNHY